MCIFIENNIEFPHSIRWFWNKTKVTFFNFWLIQYISLLLREKCLLFPWKIMRLILFSLIFIQTKHMVCVSMNTFPYTWMLDLLSSQTKVKAIVILRPSMPLTTTDISFLIDPRSNRDWDNILLNYSHFPVNRISIYLHFMPYLLRSLQLPCKRRLNCHPFLPLNSLVNIKPYLLLINPQLKIPFLFINYSNTQKLGEYGRPPFDATEARIIKTIGWNWCKCMYHLFHSHLSIHLCEP